MGYTPTYGAWHDSPNTTTPINATVLSNMDNSLSSAAYTTDTALATDIVFQRKLAADAFPRIVIYGSGRMLLLPGTVNPASVTDDGAMLVVVAGAGQNAVSVRANPADTGIHALDEWRDLNGALIAYLANVGGLKVNDSISTIPGILSVPNWSADIYGYMLQRGSMTFRHGGPPGNMLDIGTAAAEGFQGTRAGSIGNWVTGSGATAFASIANPFTTNPGETFHIIQMTQGIGSNMVARTATIGTFSTWTPTVTSNFAKAIIYIRSASATRSVTPSLVFSDNTGATIAGTINGTAGNSVTGAWTQLTVGGVVPASAAGVCLQLGASSMGASEIHYVAGTGIWVDTRTSSSADPNAENAWSPPFTGQNNGTNFGYALTGDSYYRTDVPGTSGKRHYMLDGTVGTYYLPNAVGAPGSTAQPRWVSVS